MLICPECTAVLNNGDGTTCENCDWRGERKEGIPSYLSKRDSSDPVLRSYFDNYDRIASDDLEDSIMDERYVQNLASNLCNLVYVTEGAGVCDIGSGKGFFAKNLLAKGARRVTAVDISIDYLRRLRAVDGLRPVIANAENLPFREEFDIIVTSDVLEHVMNVGSALYCINRALKPMGRVYIRVPFDENLLSYSPHLDCTYRFVHLRSYDKKILKTYLETAGFAIERFVFDGFWLYIPQPFWQKGTVRKRFFERFKKWCSERLESPVDITKWRGDLLKWILKPTVLVVAARKIKTIEPLKKGDYRLI